MLDEEAESRRAETPKSMRKVFADTGLQFVMSVDNHMNIV